MLEDWTIYSWYCPNCKTQVAGAKKQEKSNQSYLHEMQCRNGPHGSGQKARCD